MIVKSISKVYFDAEFNNVMQGIVAVFVEGHDGLLEAYPMKAEKAKELLLGDSVRLTNQQYYQELCWARYATSPNAICLHDWTVPISLVEKIESSNA